MKLIPHHVNVGGVPTQPGRSVLGTDGGTFTVNECVVLHSTLTVRALWKELQKNPVLEILGDFAGSDLYATPLSSFYGD